MHQTSIIHVPKPIPVVPTPSSIKSGFTATSDVAEEDSVIETQHEKTPFPIITTNVPEPSSILQVLAPLDNLTITRRLRYKAVLFWRKKRGSFDITSDGHTVYTAQDNSCVESYFSWSSLRPFQLQIKDSQGTEVMRIARPCFFTLRVMPCFLQKMKVFSPPGTLIGTIEQKWTPIKPKYLVKNANGEEVFWIRGPRITTCIFRDVNFQISRPDGSPVGVTKKTWDGIITTLFITPFVSRLELSFENSLLLEEKALLMASALLFNFMYYDI